MATIQDRSNPSRKVSVTADGEMVVTGSNPDGSIDVNEAGDQSLIIDDATATSTTYFCYAETGSSTADAVWKIKIIDESGGYPIIKYADGDDSYDNVAANRTSLSYS